jgi:metal-responsive CopG/Arc/MetJ family transcriptional regulator
MSRITISLPDDLLALIHREARRLDASVSDVIRRAVRSQLGVALDGAKKIPFTGIGRSGHAHTARDAEKHLR